MRSQCAVYVDAGYLMAATAQLIAGTSLRASIKLDAPKLITALIDTVEDACDLPLLRVNWYDGARPGGPDETQSQIGALRRVKLRLGRVGYEGEQKGVDLRIGLDLVNQSRTGAIDVMYLLSGDDDLTEAVEEAQANGVQVFVLAVPDSDGNPHGVSNHLRREADGVELIPDLTLRHCAVKVLTKLLHDDVFSSAETSFEQVMLDNGQPTPAQIMAKIAASSGNDKDTAPAATDVFAAVRVEAAQGPGFDPFTQDNIKLMDAVCDRVVSALQEIDEIVKARPSIPREIDRALLVDLCDASGVYDLDDQTRHELRRRFWDAVDDATVLEP